MQEKSFLITGGSGSFGNAFTKYLLDNGAERIVIFSRDEVKQYEMSQKFTDKRMRFFIGDVRDRERLRRAFDGVDVVIHAAALKRIETGFYNPGEMVKTNVMGAMNVIEAATDARVKKVVALSTDKAFKPISAYGHSKALAESLFLNANNARGSIGPKFSVTRYGNVIGSRGSIIPKWLKILENKDEVEVTDPECTRFLMSMEHACDLVMLAIETMPEHVCLPTLDAFKIGDLAKAMSARIKITGLPSWEKKHESLDHDYSSDSVRLATIDELRKYVGSYIREQYLEAS